MENKKLKYECKCGRIYKHKSSLTTHQKKCAYEPEKTDENKETETETKASETKGDFDFTQVALDLLKNTYLQEQINRFENKCNVNTNANTNSLILIDKCLTLINKIHL
jgi:hypothetical protein